MKSHGDIIIVNAIIIAKSQREEDRLAPEFVFGVV